MIIYLAFSIIVQTLENNLVDLSTYYLNSENKLEDKLQPESPIAKDLWENGSKNIYLQWITTTNIEKINLSTLTLDLYAEGSFSYSRSALYLNNAKINLLLVKKDDPIMIYSFSTSRTSIK